MIFLPFFRKPIVGQDTVCVFCLTRCASKSPKILTCLHSACSDCFKERLEASRRENKPSDAVMVDEDGCPIAMEVNFYCKQTADQNVNKVSILQVTVSCPLCKVTTSEKEIVDNLFLMASEEPDMDDEIPDTQMCSVS